MCAGIVEVLLQMLSDCIAVVMTLWPETAVSFLYCRERHWRYILILFHLPSKVHSVLSVLCSVLCVLCSVFCVLCPVLCVLCSVFCSKELLDIGFPEISLEMFSHFEITVDEYMHHFLN